MVLWLIGLSGAGKTVIGNTVFRQVREKYPNSFFLDGDMFRYVMGNDLGHSIEDRRENADRMCRMCKCISEQGIHVICAILSLFHESQKWNRENLNDYFEVYLKVSMDELLRRDSKGLYQKAKEGSINNVVGVDIPFSPPIMPDLILENEGEIPVETVADSIYAEILKRELLA